MKKLIYLLIAVSLMLVLLPAAAFADTEDAPLVTDLIAGQHTNVGNVSVWNDGDYLYVKYETSGGWCLTETHLHVATSLAGIPQKNGNPVPGQFEYQGEQDCVTEYPYPPIDLNGWEPGTELYIAAHAVVQEVVTEAPYYASTVVASNQGSRKDGTPVRPARSIPEQGLEFETGQDENNFFSLGFGGSIVVGFDCPIRNGEDYDVKVIEDTWGPYPLEKAAVYASQDGTTWAYLGEADNLTRDVDGIHTISELDLGDLGWAKYIRIVDTTDPAVHNATADGYDLNAVVALQDCVQEETAWGAGFDFPGKNWATYIEYTVQGGEIPVEWPEGGTLSVAYEDLPIGGGNDWDYNDFVVDIDTLATFFGTSTDRDLIQMDFTVRPEAKMAGYTHVMHLDANTFACNGTYELHRDGSLVESGNYNDGTGIDVVLVPNTGSAPNTVLLTISFTGDCDFSFPMWDHNLYHGENLFYDPYLHVNNTGEDVHTGDVRMLTVPVDWQWPTPDGTRICNVYPKVTNCYPGSPVFVPNWWTQ